MQRKTTPIRIKNGKVYAWIKNKSKKNIIINGDIHNPCKPGNFYLAQPTAKDTILFEPYGKAHTTLMTIPN